MPSLLLPELLMEVIDFLEFLQLLKLASVSHQFYTRFINKPSRKLLLQDENRHLLRTSLKDIMEFEGISSEELAAFCTENRKRLLRVGTIQQLKVMDGRFRWNRWDVNNFYNHSTWTTKVILREELTHLPPEIRVFGLSVHKKRGIWYKYFNEGNFYPLPQLPSPISCSLSFDEAPCPALTTLIRRLPEAYNIEFVIINLSNSFSNADYLFRSSVIHGANELLIQDYAGLSSTGQIDLLIKWLNSSLKTGTTTMDHFRMLTLVQDKYCSAQSSSAAEHMVVLIKDSLIKCFFYINNNNNGPSAFIFYLELDERFCAGLTTPAEAVANIPELVFAENHATGEQLIMDRRWEQVEEGRYNFSTDRKLVTVFERRLRGGGQRLRPTRRAVSYFAREFTPTIDISNEEGGWDE